MKYKNKTLVTDITTYAHLCSQAEVNGDIGFVLAPEMAISREIGHDEGSVKKSLDRLCDAGIIEIRDAHNPFTITVRVLVLPE